MQADRIRSIQTCIPLIQCFPIVRHTCFRICMTHPVSTMFPHVSTERIWRFVWWNRLRTGSTTSSTWSSSRLAEPGHWPTHEVGGVQQKSLMQRIGCFACYSTTSPISQVAWVCNHASVLRAAGFRPFLLGFGWCSETGAEQFTHSIWARAFKAVRQRMWFIIGLMLFCTILTPLYLGSITCGVTFLSCGRAIFMNILFTSTILTHTDFNNPVFFSGLLVAGWWAGRRSATVPDGEIWYNTFKTQSRVHQNTNRQGVVFCC